MGPTKWLAVVVTLRVKASIPRDYWQKGRKLEEKDRSKKGTTTWCTPARRKEKGLREGFESRVDRYRKHGIFAHGGFIVICMVQF